MTTKRSKKGMKFEMNKEEKNVIKKSIIMGIIAAICIFTIGFVVLAIMYYYWNKTQTATNLKGLFDFKASAFGDSLCLPIFIGAMVSYVFYLNNLVKLKHKYTIPALVGTASAIVGAYIQATWIWRDNTILNWSIPRVHYFNYAGWYHAFFFVLMFFLIGYLFTAMIITEKNIKKINDFEKSFSWNFYNGSQILIWNSSIIFFILHFLDDYSQKCNKDLIICATSAVCLAIIIFVKLIIMRKKIKIKSITPVFFASIISALAMYIITNGGITEHFHIVIASVLLSTLYIFNNSNKIKMICMGALYGTLTWIFHYHLLNFQYTSMFVIIECIIFFLPSAIAFIDYNIFEKKKWNDEGYNHNKVIWVATIINGIIAINIILKDTQASVILEILSALISGIIPFYIVASFDRIKEIEDKKENEIDFIKSMKLSQYIIYFCLYLAVIILLLRYIEFNLDFNISKKVKLLIFITFVLISILCFILKFVKNIKLSIFVAILTYVTIIIYAIISISFNFGDILKNKIDKKESTVIITNDIEKKINSAEEEDERKKKTEKSDSNKELLEKQ